MATGCSYARSACLRARLRSFWGNCLALRHLATPLFEYAAEVQTLKPSNHEPPWEICSLQAGGSQSRACVACTATRSTSRRSWEASGRALRTGAGLFRTDAPAGLESTEIAHSRSDPFEACVGDAGRSKAWNRRQSPGPVPVPRAPPRCRGLAPRRAGSSFVTAEGRRKPRMLRLGDIGRLGPALALNIDPRSAGLELARRCDCLLFASMIAGASAVPLLSCPDA